MVEQVGIVGVGLIGASIGLALKERQLCDRVVGIGRRVESLEQAKQCGAVDDFTVGFDDSLKSIDLLVVCTPVHLIGEHVQQAAPFLNADALVTDAGSTKGKLVEHLESAQLPCAFVGSHPLAGSEKSGPLAGRADLFQDRTCIVTPTASSDPNATEVVTRFWQTLGMNVVSMDPHEHDKVLAQTSHLPHLVAAALARMLEDEYAPFTGTGFRDTTRIAAGDPDLWQAIFCENSQQCRLALQSFRNTLDEFQRALDQGDFQQLRELLRDGKHKRDALGS